MEFFRSLEAIKLYHIHPAIVHFPIAFLAAGFALEAFSLFRKGPEWFRPAAAWLLWSGTVLAWTASGFGLLAEKTAPHVPDAWEVLEDHEALGLWTAGVCAALSLWRWKFAEKGRRAFAAAYMAALILLLAAAYHGGQLVFLFGMGVAER